MGVGTDLDLAHHPSQRGWIRTAVLSSSVCDGLLEVDSGAQQENEIHEITRLVPAEYRAQLLRGDFPHRIDANAPDNAHRLRARNAVDDEIHDRRLIASAHEESAELTKVT